MSPDEALEAMQGLARMIAREVVAELRAGEVGMVDQSSSPLGNRRHIAAARRLIRAGDPRGIKVGRRYLLTPEAVRSELTRLGTAPKTEERDIAAELRAELRLVGGQ